MKNDVSMVHLSEKKRFVPLPFAFWPCGHECISLKGEIIITLPLLQGRAQRVGLSLGYYKLLSLFCVVLNEDLFGICYY